MIRQITKWLWLDMDGTIADLYGVEGWLEDLINHNTRPYAEAKMIYKTIDLLNILSNLKNNGYNIGIISWGSKENNKNYDKAVEKVKREWLYNNYLLDIIDKVIVTGYGINKADTCRKYGYGILVDDEEQNRKAWDLGDTINANNNILKELEKLL